MSGIPYPNYSWVRLRELSVLTNLSRFVRTQDLDGIGQYQLRLAEVLPILLTLPSTLLPLL